MKKKNHYFIENLLELIYNDDVFCCATIHIQLKKVVQLVNVDPTFNNASSAVS